MKAATSGFASSLENEFVPPLDLPDTWGLACEPSLRAIAAWQEAFEAIGEAADPNGDATGHHAGGAPTIRTVTRLSALAGSLRERFLQIQSAAADLAIAELAQRESGGTREDLALRPLQAENARRFKQLTQAWLDLVAAAQSEMTTLTGLVAEDAATPGSGVRGTFIERRRRAEVIGFPDRRAA